MDTKEIIIHLKNYADIPIHLTEYALTDAKRATFIPQFIFSASPAINISASALFQPAITFSTVNQDIQEVITIVEFKASTDDSSGRNSPAAFSATENYLYIGNDGTTSDAWRKTWIPFTTQFTTDSGDGIHIVSATLEVMAESTQSIIDGQPCKIKLGAATKPTSASPVSWSSNTSATRNLKSKTFKDDRTIYSGSLVESWVEGETYSFDVTNTVKNLFGAVRGPQKGIKGTITSTCAITWPTAGSVAALLFGDKGSSPGSYRTIVSANGHAADATLTEPTLIIEYALNSYTDSVLDTFLSGLSSAEKSKVNYANTVLYVGESSESTSGVPYKGLIKFDTASILSTMTVTSASMYLYLTANKASATAYLTALELVTDWDLYGASWYSNDGINAWAAGATGFSSSDYSTPVARVSLPYNASVGFKQISSITTPATLNNVVQGWITNPTTNKGFALLMMDVLGTSEPANSAHIFASSQYTTASCRPKLIVEYTDGSTDYSKTIQTT